MNNTARKEVKITKKQARIDSLNRHYRFLESLGAFHGVKLDGKKTSMKLWHIEREAHQLATDGCNGVIDSSSDEYTFKEDALINRVYDVLGFEPSGLFLNGDARGYALKIPSEIVDDLYYKVGFHRDMGGFGILSPDIQL